MYLTVSILSNFEVSLPTVHNANELFMSKASIGPSNTVTGFWKLTFKIPNRVEALFNCPKCSSELFLIGKENKRKKLSYNPSGSGTGQSESKFDSKFNKKFDESIKSTGEVSKYDNLKAVAGGTAAGATAAAGTAKVVAAVGTASTGKAISLIYGAAKTNATLAWLGGGSLAVGGGGMALGVALLTGAATGVGYVTYKTIKKKNKKK